MNNKSMVVLVGLFILALIFIIIVGPFFTIWSLNTLFQLEIQYTFKCWVAINWLAFLLFGLRQPKPARQSQ